MSLDLKTILKICKALPVKQENLTSYQKWALDFFHNEEYCMYPLLNLCLQFDITEAEKHYKLIKLKNQASFTAYLTWCLTKAINLHLELRLRCINGQWYDCEAPPVYSPIAIGGDRRFAAIFITNPAQKSWKEFAQEYSHQLEVAKSPKPGPTVSNLKTEGFNISTMVGNLPTMQFSSFQLHQFPLKLNTARQLFYFGKRYKQEGRTMVPLAVTMDHSNCDPFLLDILLKDYSSILSTAS